MQLVKVRSRAEAAARAPASFLGRTGPVLLSGPVQLLRQKGGCGQDGVSPSSSAKGCDQTGYLTRATVVTESKSDQKGRGERGSRWSF